MTALVVRGLEVTNEVVKTLDVTNEEVIGFVVIKLEVLLPLVAIPLVNAPDVILLEVMGDVVLKDRPVDTNT